MIGLFFLRPKLKERYLGLESAMEKLAMCMSITDNLAKPTEDSLSFSPGSPLLLYDSKLIALALYNKIPLQLGGLAPVASLLLLTLC
jgi:hypothetical protein